jgi:hypothetical protein
MRDIERLLADDFNRLVARLQVDGFAERAIKRLKSSDRSRLVFIGAAGGLGALAAASQFGSLAAFIARIAPSTETSALFEAMNGSQAIAALIFASVAAATAALAPSSR